MSDKKKTSITLTATARVLAALLSEKHGIGQTAVIELAIREKAERDAVRLPES